MMSNNNSGKITPDEKRAIEGITGEYRKYLEQYIVTDSDDFTGMYTETPIPDDGFYGESYKMERELVKLFEEIISSKVNEARIDELRHLRIPTQTLRDQIDDRIKTLKRTKLDQLSKEITK